MADADRTPSPSIRQHLWTPPDLGPSAAWPQILHCRRCGTHGLLADPTDAVSAMGECVSEDPDPDQEGGADALQQGGTCQRS